MKTVLITGGAGYVGSRLTTKLLNQGYKVVVIDLFLYDARSMDHISHHKDLVLVRGDIRDKALLAKIMPGVDTVIHLACISNDPSFDLNPKLGKSINLDAFRPFVEVCKKYGVKRFINASSSSVYGIKKEENVTEDMSLEPLTDYSKFKAETEKILQKLTDDRFTTVSIRCATVCGFSTRQRLDVIVNILANHAYNKRVMQVHGGQQKRPNVHIEDVVDMYIKLVDIEKEKISGKIFNFGAENHTLNELADIVKSVIGDDVEIAHSNTDDLRSYHISSEKIKKELGIVPRRSIKAAVKGIKTAFEKGFLKNTFSDKKYFNLEVLKETKL